MANATDAAIVVEMGKVQHLPDRCIDTLERLAPQIVDDSFYWLMVLTSWVGAGEPYLQERYRVLFSEKGRRNRIRAMKRGSLAIWRKLPDPIIAYHAVEHDDPDVDRAIAWTLDPAVARKFGDVVVCRSFPKRVVPFYTDRRAEAEVIVLAAWEGTELPADTKPCVDLARIKTSRGPAHSSQEIQRREQMARATAFACVTCPGLAVPDIEAARGHRAAGHQVYAAVPER